jgi:branched-chain amino acid transport system permease protein
MHRYLTKNYALLGKEVKTNDKITNVFRKIIKTPSIQFILFGILMCIVGVLATEKILPYSWQSAFATTFSFAIASIGFCLLMGYSGLASLGTGGFIGIGTYAVHYVMVEAQLPFIVALVVAIAISLLIGLIVGFISLRIEGIYLVILTLALSEILRTLYGAIEPKLALSAKNAVLFGKKFPTSQSLILVTIFLVIIMIITSNLINSPTGRAMLAMKNSTAAAQAMGISLIKYRLMAFIICTAYASVSGVLLMMVVRSADATDPTGYYALITSLNILAAVIIGGYKSIWGAVFGTFVMYGIKLVIFNQIPFLAKNSLIITLVSGILVIFIAMYYPGGLAQLLLEAKTKIKSTIKKIKEGIYGKDLG